MRILLADDDRTILRIASLALKARGHEVSCASDGAQALAMAEAEPPELILLDGLMPVMDGMEAFRRLRAGPKTKDVPVIFLSAQQEPEELSRLESLGAAGIIHKPFDPMALAGRVETILGRSGPQ